MMRGIFRKIVSVKGIVTLILVVWLFAIVYLVSIDDVDGSLGFSKRSLNVIRNMFSGNDRRGFCRNERQNFVFIKCMKCATETLASVFRRFGYVRNLSFMIPVGFERLWIGWPKSPKEQDYRPSERGYNILTEHAVYNKTFLKSVMPDDTVYISIIRDPYKRFVSTFYYFDIQFYTKISYSIDDPVKAFLKHIGKYETIYKNSQTAVNRGQCPPQNFSVTRNLMAHCLGMPLGYPTDVEDFTWNRASVVDYLKQLDQDFLLVLLAEHFLESMVLLKRLMCWTFKDILYVTVNVADYEHNVSAKYVKIYQEFSQIDYLLYDYFNKSFWKKVGSQSPDFCEEVVEFLRMNEMVRAFCEQNFPDKVLTVNESLWSPGFSITSLDCDLMTVPLLPVIKARYDCEEASHHPPVKQSKLTPDC